jgi:hypothetical protein
MSSDKKQNIQTQLDRANAILNDLRPNVTAQDREDAQKELDLSPATVNRYILGEGKRIDTALDLIEFFQKRIKGREKKLAGAA